MKRALRRMLLGPESIPQYAAVGVLDPQQQIQVLLDGLGTPLDVTWNNVAVSLRPFLIGIGLPSRGSADALCRASPSLSFHEREGGKPIIGTIRLRFRGAVPLGASRLCVFETRGHTNRCLSPARLRLHYLYQRWRMSRNRDPYNFKMVPNELWSFFVFYTSPRPVALISVESGSDRNIFPMDLIGPTDSPYFLLALRSTSPSVELIKQSRRVALSRIPLEYKAVAYELGKHHKLRTVDLDNLPFPIERSARFGLRIPREASGVEELDVAEVHVFGSHTVFVTIPVYEESRDTRLRMHHVQGFYQDYLKRAGRPLPEASSLNS